MDDANIEKILEYFARERRKNQTRLDILNGKRSSHEHGISCLIRCPFKNIEDLAKSIKRLVLTYKTAESGIKNNNYMAAIDLLGQLSLEFDEKRKEPARKIFGPGSKTEVTRYDQTIDSILIRDWRQYLIKKGNGSKADNSKN